MRPGSIRRTPIPRILQVSNPEEAWRPEILRPPRPLWVVRNMSRRNVAVSVLSLLSRLQ